MLNLYNLPNDDEIKKMRKGQPKLLFIDIISRIDFHVVFVQVLLVVPVHSVVLVVVASVLLSLLFQDIFGSTSTSTRVLRVYK
jgi:hypothetical protein